MFSVRYELDIQILFRLVFAFKELNTSSTSRTIMPRSARRLMNDEWERLWKELAISQKELRNSTTNFIPFSQRQVQDSKWHLSNTCQVKCTLSQPARRKEAGFHLIHRTPNSQSGGVKEGGRDKVPSSDMK